MKSTKPINKSAKDQEHGQQTSAPPLAGVSAGAVLLTFLVLGASIVVWGHFSKTPTPPKAADKHAYEESKERVEARHVLIQYQSAFRASPSITRSKAEALTRAKEALAKLRGGADFVQVVIDYSDEPGADKRGGRLGRLKPGRDMTKEFMDAALKMEVGELSDVVETVYGFHIIHRTGR